VPQLELVGNLAVNGYTTADLMRDELPAMHGLAPDLVTLLIGVNDVVQGVSAARYESNVSQVLDVLLASLPPGRIVTVSIPDYTVTPAGADYGDPARQRAGILTSNAAMARLAAERQITVVDIFDLSERAARDPTLVAGDGLHPSGAQYAMWVERIAPAVRSLMG
jgi:lysophospholipase L1-like esterase